MQVNKQTVSSGHEYVKNSDYHAILAAQGGVCAICSERPLNGKRLLLNRNRKTGRVRGLLCKRCQREVIEAEAEVIADAQRWKTFLAEERREQEKAEEWRRLAVQGLAELFVSSERAAEIRRVYPYHDGVYGLSQERLKPAVPAGASSSIRRANAAVSSGRPVRSENAVFASRTTVVKCAAPAKAAIIADGDLIVDFSRPTLDEARRKAASPYLVEKTETQKRIERDDADFAVGFVP